MLVDILHDCRNRLQNVSEVNTSIDGAVSQIDQDHKDELASFLHLELANHEACKLVDFLDGGLPHEHLHFCLIAKELSETR